MKRLLTTALLVASLPALAQVDRPPVTLDEYPVTDGSVCTRPIGRALFAAMFHVPWRRLPQEAVSPDEAAPGDAIEPVGALTEAPTVQEGWARVAEHSGTHEAYRRLIHGAGESAEPSLIFASRPPSYDERRTMRRAGVELDCAPIARDALVFIVREDCPVEALTLEQVRGIFLGHITNWREVGGPDAPIVAVTREANSGSGEILRYEVLCGRTSPPAGHEGEGRFETARGPLGPFAKLAALDEPTGIACTFLSYREKMARPRGTKCLAVDGVMPGAETVASGEYPLCTSVWAVTRTSEDDDGPALRLRDWLLTRDAQRIIARMGVVPLYEAWPMLNRRHFDPGEYPRTNGSTSACPLADMVALSHLHLPWKLRIHRSHGIGGSPPDAFLPRRLLTSEWGSDVATFLHRRRHSGTHGAWIKLLRHEADLIFECRLPSEDERAEIDRLGVEFDARPVARDAFVFIMNENAPIDGLTLEQIRDIYTGEITNWSEVGVTGELPEEWSDTIEPWRRNRNSGSQETMMSLVMRDREMVESPGDFVTYDMHGPFGVLHAKANAICFTFWSYHHLMLPDRGVKMLAVDGVYPTRDTIRSGAYPLVTDTYVVVRASSPDYSPEVHLRDWLLREDGQRVVGRSGYLPLQESRGEGEDP